MAIDKLRVRNILVKQLGVEEEAADALTYALAEPLESDTDLAIGGFEERTGEEFAGIRRDFERHEVENREQFNALRSDLQRHDEQFAAVRSDLRRHDDQFVALRSDVQQQIAALRSEMVAMNDQLRHEFEVDRANTDHHWNEWFERYDSDRAADARQRQADREADARMRQAEREADERDREAAASRRRANREADSKQRETEAELRAAERRADLAHYERMTWRVVAAALGGAAAIAGLAALLIRLL